MYANLLLRLDDGAVSHIQKNIIHLLLGLGGAGGCRIVLRSKSFEEMAVGQDEVVDAG